MIVYTIAPLAVVYICWDVDSFPIQVKANFIEIIISRQQRARNRLSDSVGIYVLQLDHLLLNHRYRISLFAPPYNEYWIRPLSSEGPLA